MAKDFERMEDSNSSDNPSIHEISDPSRRVVLLGGESSGKTTLAQNIAHQAILAGHTVLFSTAGQLLGDLCAIDSDAILRRRLRHYARPDLLVIDEVGYLSYSNRHADLMFELVSRRHLTRSTIITTSTSNGSIIHNDIIL